jgi:D-glycero-alpha-D-manno-heptose 1-phosphate guanylyltransferase
LKPPCFQKNNLLKEAIILAGGFGTRLKTVVSDLPKPMAPVNGKPFLDYLLAYLAHYNIQKVVLSVGHLADKIIQQYGNSFKGISISYAHEKEPLGTGGGIRLAMEQCHSRDILVLNGDSFFDIDLNKLYEYHCPYWDCTIALRKVADASRYGTIKLNYDLIKEFREKDGLHKEGIINAGVYLLKRDFYLDKTKPHVNFSIERDFFEARINEMNISGIEQKAYFIDIGIPEDYQKAQNDFKQFAY